MESTSQLAQYVRASVLALARNSEVPWQKIAQDLLLLRGSDSTVEWNLVSKELPWSQLGTPAFAETFAQGSLFSVDQFQIAGLETALEELEALRAVGAFMALCCDSEFPSQLLDTKQTLPFIFYAGHVEPNDTNGVAIIGTRSASGPAMDAAARFASTLADQGRTVVSGLASGIDTAALKSALRSQGRAVAVIGTGITKVYPPENALLQSEIAERGLLISQFLPTASPTKTSFPMRNAVMSAYAKASLVIQADDRSGARLQARIAAEQGRDVYLYEPVMKHEAWAKVMANKGHAKFITDVSGIG